MVDLDSLYRFNYEKLPENFVAIAVNIAEFTYEPNHAGILIRHENINYLHHFPGFTKPEITPDFDEEDWYVYKILDSFDVNDSSDVGAFLQYCKRICAQSEITYSYIADGSSYSDRGEFMSKISLPELGTCVGFCINTLTNAIVDVRDSFLKLDDWDDSEIADWIDKRNKNQVGKKYPDLDWTLYNAFKKRVTPLEYLCCAFFKEYPIVKNDIDSIKIDVTEKIKSIYN